MTKIRSSGRRWGWMAAGLLAFTLAGCGGGDSAAPPTAEPPPVELPPTIDTGPRGLAASTSLDIRVDSASIGDKPVIEFTVTNQAGAGMTGLTAADLRFNIAKLVRGGDGEPNRWQNYINRVRNGVVQGSQERVATGFAFGTLTGLGSGRYRYEFATNIADAAANPCPAPCVDTQGKPLDLRYDPALTHRVTIQQGNADYPRATGVLDFVPNGAAPTSREIVATATCNSCHAQITAHGTRVDTKLCVTCHNPGSTGTGGVSLDFNALVHRIHFNNAGAALPSVQAGVPYVVGGHDYSKVTFTQDVRNCTRCHDATGSALTAATPQGDRWKAQPTLQACGSCHDNVYFGSAPDPTKPYQTKAHSGGVVTDNSQCAMCHAPGKYSDSKDVAVAHSHPARMKAAAARFKFNVLSVANTAPGATPVVTFSVTDPTRGDAPYDIKTDPAFTAPGGVAALTIRFAWTTTDFGNAGNNVNLGQPLNVNALTASVAGPTPGTFAVTAPAAVPLGLTGSMRVTIEGRTAGDVTTPGTFTDRLMVKAAFRDVAVTGAVSPRRTVVDIAKCNVCHDTLSLHGGARTDEPGLCVACHNPNGTDLARRPAGGGTDGKAEESIDFRTMIHAIHAGEAGKGGIRTKGVTLYGFGNVAHDYSGVAFPGRIGDCATCHVGSTYALTGVWASPTANGILGTTTSSGASRADPADNLRTSPTAAVCSSCHDSAVARVHMQDPGSGGRFGATQAAIDASGGENCTFCHGDGRAFDVKTMHGQK